MHGRKLTLNEVNDEKVNYHFTFNHAQICEKVFIYHKFLIQKLKYDSDMKIRICFDIGIMPFEKKNHIKGDLWIRTHNRQEESQGTRDLTTRSYNR